MSSQLIQRYSDKCAALNIKPTKRFALVSIDEQRLVLVDGDSQQAYPISTSTKAPSCLQDSGGTPSGLHKIAAKIGDGQPIDTVFKGRVSIGNTYQALSAEEQSNNLITSRILWLDGLEPGLNQGPGCDSHQRYIYIHGTNHEDRIGQPASGGCIQLKNRETITLHNAMDEGEHVYIA